MSVAAAAVAAGAIGATSNIGQTVYSTERNIANANWQADLQRNFEERMASTQYQRAVADMKAAGLNPGAIGAGMSSNAVPTAQAATGNYGHVLGVDFSNIFGSAVQMAMSKDKNVASKVIEEMKVASAKEVQNLRNEGNLKVAATNAKSFMDVEKYRKKNEHLAYYRKDNDEDFSSQAKNPPKWKKAGASSKN